MQRIPHDPSAQGFQQMDTLMIPLGSKKGPCKLGGVETLLLPVAASGFHVGLLSIVPNHGNISAQCDN